MHLAFKRKSGISGKTGGMFIPLAKEEVMPKTSLKL
jgi:hypothetical protein